MVASAKDELQYDNGAGFYPWADAGATVLEQRCIDTNAHEGVALWHHPRILEEILPFDLVDPRQRMIRPYGKGDIITAKHLVVQMWPVSAS